MVHDAMLRYLLLEQENQHVFEVSYHGGNIPHTVFVCLLVGWFLILER